MLDGRISSCLTTLFVHLPSCNQTRPSQLLPCHRAGEGDVRKSKQEGGRVLHNVMKGCAAGSRTRGSRWPHEENSLG